MELRTIRYFVAVAEEGSLTAAAEVVRVTQPALSRQLAQFERELGVALFHRPGRSLELTAAGREFLPIAREVLERSEAAVKAADDLAAGGLRRVVISAPATTATDVVAPFLATLTTSDPMPTVVEADGDTALAMLRSGTDLAVLTQLPPRDTGNGRHRTRRVADLPIFAYVPEHHPWDERTEITLRELVTEPLIVPDRTFRTRQLLESALVREDVAVGDELECGNAQVAQAMAAAGWGVAVVSDDPRFGLVPIPVMTVVGPLQIRLYAAWLETHHAEERLAALADRLADFVERRYRSGAR